MPSFDRRRLLQSLALSALGAGIPGCERSRYDLDYLEDTPDFTHQRAPHYFVFYFLMGGWDITTLTEPRVKGARMSPSYKPGAIFEYGGHRLGPAMQPLVRHMDQMAVLRGLRATALNHPQARFQLVTGKFREPRQAPAASIQTRLADLIGRDYPIPNLSADGLRPATFLGDYDPHLEPFRIGEMYALRGLSRPRGPMIDQEDVVFEALRKRDAAYVAKHAESAMAENFAASAELARQAAESDYRWRASEFVAPRFKETANLEHKNRWGYQVHLVVEAIRNDIAPIITAGSGEFDAHNEHDYGYHQRAITRSMEAVAAICDGLAEHRTADGGTLLDRTTVVISSEFSRQPWINELGGKHHWDANAALFLGKGVRGTKGGLTMVGECDEQLFPQPLNPVTGKPDRGADDVTNGHFLATVLAMAGIDPGPHFDQSPIQGLIA
ncbi:MAG TPA: hypothetical protein DFR83_17820 [Deltaproteobacteria bacterium]|nr:hypothetical protein [Deltaproteobacteria bacterium]